MQGGIAQSAGDGGMGSVSGLPIPRFVSLKSDRVNARSGPNKDQEVRWVYTHAGMPVEITAEFENWRRIRDWEGAEGWVYHTLLSGKRTAVVVPKSKDDLVPIYDSANEESSVAARLQSGVLGAIKSCDGAWCQFGGKGFDGFIRQERLIRLRVSVRRPPNARYGRRQAQYFLIDGPAGPNNQRKGQTRISKCKTPRRARCFIGQFLQLQAI